MTTDSKPSALPPQIALELLREGNRRFVSGESSLDGSAIVDRREGLVAGQTPFAVILGCSDSRVPPELIFDRGLGDLFVIRVAGNIVKPSAVESVEYAVEHLKTRLVVVLGHTRCGAVRATLEELERPTKEQSPNLGSIVDSIRPSVEPLLGTGSKADLDLVLVEAIRANVRASVGLLRQGSRVLERLIENDGLVVVGAEYSLETGVVDFFDGSQDLA
jgi:carbonic anhydrase